MLRRLALFTCIMLFMMLSFAPASAQDYSVTCANGSVISDATFVTVVSMRSGFNYTATAIGINGFDPLLAVFDSNGGIICQDDTTGATTYTVNLPTTGLVAPSNLSSQITFSHNDPSGFADITLAVGGFGATSGEFVLILEGMGVTPADNAGDPFSVNISPSMIASGVPLTAYMISYTTSLDSYLYLTDTSFNTVTDPNGSAYACDDAGNSNLCWGFSVNLSNSYVTTARGNLPGYQRDAMLSLPLELPHIDPTIPRVFVNFLATSSSGTSTGEYAMAFHMGLNSSGAIQPPVATEEVFNNQIQPPVVTQEAVQAGGGVAMNCPNGGSFTNGVEFVVVGQRAGFNYRATTIGINGFDPVLTVGDLADESGSVLCNDDAPTASSYTADLPTTGLIGPSGLSAQVTFSNNSPTGFADIQLVVGGRNDQDGQFLLIVEGMGVTGADNAGDPFDVYVTPRMADAGVPLAVYMISYRSNLDSLLSIVDTNLNTLVDSSGNPFRCDDAGKPNLCWGQSFDLSIGHVTNQNGRLGGGPLDSMLVLPLELPYYDRTIPVSYYRFLASSLSQSTFGQYALAFHAATG